MERLDRLANAQNALTRDLVRIMREKKTNLCLALDVSSCAEVRRILPLVAEHICLLKLHIDVYADYDSSFLDYLSEAKAEYGLLVFEDRKFADIGSTAAAQYEGGIYKISSWADLVTVHAIAGPGTLKAMASVAGKIGAPRGALLLAEMSSEGNLCSKDYQDGAITQAKSYPEFVTGFISQRRQPNLPSEALVLTPGVNMDIQGDGLGQQFASPRNAVERGADIIIVGRGIYQAEDICSAARRYKEAGWAAIQ
ncbi:orotidine 5'-phosphate decarboxylase [Savitreella phatthalungensis]